MRKVKLRTKDFSAIETYSAAPFTSAGDMLERDGKMFLATGSNELAVLGKDDTFKSFVDHNVSSLYGLSLNKDDIIGFAGNRVYEIDKDGAKLVETFDTYVSIYGAETLETLKVKGTDKADLLEGDFWSETLLGRGRADLIAGNDGNDTLLGGKGRDVLLGGDGKDRLVGGAGDDVHRGGSGKDVFVFEKGDGDDLIYDFRPGYDRIEIGQGASKASQIDISNHADGIELSFKNVSIVLVDETLKTFSLTDDLVFA